MRYYRDTAVFLRREFVVRSYCRSFDTVFQSASGSMMIDVDGREYIDFLAGCGGLNYGHNEPGMSCGAGRVHSGRRRRLRSGHVHRPKARFLEWFESSSSPRAIWIPGAVHRADRRERGRGRAEAGEEAYQPEERHRLHAGFHGLTLGALAATANRLPDDAALAGAYAHHATATSARKRYAAMLERVPRMRRAVLTLPPRLWSRPCKPKAGSTLPPALARGSRRSAGARAADRRRHPGGCGRTGTFFSFEGMNSRPTWWSVEIIAG